MYWRRCDVCKSKLYGDERDEDETICNVCNNCCCTCKTVHYHEAITRDDETEQDRCAWTAYKVIEAGDSYYILWSYDGQMYFDSKDLTVNQDEITWDRLEVPPFPNTPAGLIAAIKTVYEYSLSEMIGKEHADENPVSDKA